MGKAHLTIELKNRGVKLESGGQHERLAVMDFKGSVALLELGFINSEHDRTRMIDRAARVHFWELLVQKLLG
ncbi:MAG: hypothetical protein RLZZ156_2187 [Deinococcota bacterium]